MTVFILSFRLLHLLFLDFLNRAFLLAYPMSSLPSSVPTNSPTVSILRKKRQQVTGYEVHISGIRAEENPMVFVEIAVEHIVTGHHVQSEAVARAIQLSEERY